jgi:hypothetical protein
MNVDLQEYKQPWLDYCAAKGVTPSEAFRQIVAKLVGQDSLEKSRPGDDELLDGWFRTRVRLTEAEYKEANAIAFHEGFSLGKWIVALVRARLGSGAQLGQDELEALARSNMQLLTLGRNLNQIAKALNVSPENYRLFNVALIETLQVSIKDHTAIVASVMASNVDRWKQK